MSLTIRSILADVDPRREEQPSLSRAELLAAKTGASLCLYASDYLYPFGGSVFFDSAEEQKARDAYLANLENWLKDAAGQLDPGIDVSTVVEWQASRVDGLLAQAANVGADVIVRGATRHSRVDRLLLGATDWELIRRAPQILWLAKGERPPAENMKVLAAVDPTHAADERAELDRRLLETAAGISGLFGGSLHALHAYMPVPRQPIFEPGAAMGTAAAPAPPLDEELLEKLQERLSGRITELTDEYDVPRNNVHVIAGPTTSTIDDFVEDNDIDVVVAGAVSRSWLERLIIGSTAERLLDAVDCDVVIVKPADFGREEEKDP